MPTANTNLIDQIFIQVDGTDLKIAIMDMLEQALVEHDLAQPAMFELRFHDPNFQLIDGNLFKLGAEVTIGANNQSGQRKPLLTGEVTALEPELEQFGTTLVVRGYDRAHRLYRGRKTRTFLKKTDSEIAGQIAREAGFSADVESSPIKHDYLVQNNQTDMEFLRARAARVGFRVVANGTKLSFRQAESAPPSAPEQKLGETLLSFRPRLSAVGQPNTVQVRGWDPKTKQAVVGSATTAVAPTAIGYGQAAGKAAQQAFSSAATLTVASQPVATQAEAEKLAQALLNDIAGSFITAEGQCLGEPAIKAGVSLPIKGVGTRFSGSYFVTATRHHYTAEQGYLTSFSVNGHAASGMLATIDQPAAGAGVGGVVVGVVTNLNDPDKLGRVKVKYPWLDDTQESDWARLAQPGAGNGRGLFLPPEVNDEVLIAFEQGDFNRPYVIGGLWNTKDKPPAAAVAEGKVTLRTLKTRAGHVIELGEDDGGNKGYILLKTATGRLITISDTDKQIQIKSDKHTLTLDDQGQAVKIESGGTLELKGSGQKLSFSQSGIEISGPGGKLQIATGGIELTANTNLTMKGNANVDVQANAMLNIKSSAILNIQGTLVKIN